MPRNYSTSNPFALDGAAATYPDWDGNALKLYNDAAAHAGGGGTFSDLTAAINDARHIVFIADWSFQPITRLTPHEKDGGKSIGELLAERAVALPDLTIAIHTWDHTDVLGNGAPDPQNDEGYLLLEEAYRQRYRGRYGKDPGEALPGGVPPRRNLFWKKSSRTGENGDGGLGWSHHQKFVVLDTAVPGTTRRRLTAFVGGLDLTKGRVDWPEHRNLGTDEQLAVFQRDYQLLGKTYNDWYNPEFGAIVDRPIAALARDANGREQILPRQSWHDICSQLTGPAAWDIVREFVGRWIEDPATPGATFSPLFDHRGIAVTAVLAELLGQLSQNPRLFQQWEEDQCATGVDRKSFSLVNVQVVRSITRDQWGGSGADAYRVMTYDPNEASQARREFEWSITRDRRFEASIQEAYRRHIELAQDFIYIETQYFIGAGDKWFSDAKPEIRNQVPAWLVERILARKKERKDFHVYILLPLFPEGDPTDGTSRVQRRFQWKTIEYMIRSLYERGIGDNWRRYLSFYFLGQWSDRFSRPRNEAQPMRVDRVRAARRYMIYVHSKLMICDDRSLIVGSANLNERSLAGGRDAEVCISVAPDARDPEGSRQVVGRLRRELWREHLRRGVAFNDSPDPLPDGDDWWRTPGAEACVRRVQTMADQNAHNFLRHQLRASSGHLCAWPLVYVPALRELRRIDPAAPGTLEDELVPEHTEDALLASRPTYAKVAQSPYAIAPAFTRLGALEKLAE